MNKKNKKKEKIKKIKKAKFKLWLKFIFLSVALVFFIVLGILFFWISSLKIPNIYEIQNIKIDQSTKIYDKSGKILLFNIYGDETRTVVPLSKISKNIINATIAVEDKDFYKHKGVKITSILRAAYENFTGKGIYKRGGSTITQQVIKNTLLTRERTYTRKIKEAILAYKLEKFWTKDKILELYLNDAPYGGTIYGAEEAARYYFNKPASEVGIAEAAYLAAMPQAPSRYSPYGKNRKLLDQRKNIVLSLMLNQGYINVEEYKKARDEEVEFVFKSKKSNLKAPHFTMYVVKQLEELFGEKNLKTKGYKVITTLDYELQKELEKIAKEKILENEEEFGVSNTAIVAIESQTGEVIAMVGSRDYFDEKIDGKFNVAIAKRQPGSSFKPFVYLAAFEMGYAPETVVWDVETEFNLKCDPSKGPKEDGNEDCYRPKNYDWNTDHPFHGAIQFKNALPESRNIPAVKALYLVGVENAIAMSKLMGIKSLNKPANYYGLNLVLGGGEVKLLNLTSAYGTFANEGIRVEPIVILEVRDDKDNIIYEAEVERRRVIDKKYVQNLNKILSTDALKYPTFGVNSKLYFDNKIASKTGTTNENKDSWVIGYDAGNFAVGVWTGNNNNTSPKKAMGKLTYDIWSSAVEVVMKKYPILDFPEAPPLVDINTKPVIRGILTGSEPIKIDIKTGKLATEETPEEFIKEISLPSYNSILHWVDPKDPRGPVPEIKDQAYDNWEYGVQKWILENKDKVAEELELSLEDLLNLTNDGLEDLNLNQTNIIEDPYANLNSNLDFDFEIFSPGDGDTFKEDEKMYINLKITKGRIDSFSFYVNGKFLAKSRSGKFNFKLNQIDNLKIGKNELKIVGYWKGKRIEKKIYFNIK